MKLDTLQGIVPFVQAVETGSFTRAAKRIHLTTSAVGKSIARLEERLGVRLIHRSTRSLSLTHEGEVFYQACVAALSEMDAAHARLAQYRQEPSGKLRIDLPLTFGRRCVAPILFDIVSRYPALTLEASFSDRHADLIEEGLDLTIRIGALGDSAGLAARKLFVQRSTVCASPAYLERYGMPRDVSDLEHHRLLVYGRDGFMTPWHLRDRHGKLKTLAPHATVVLGHGEPLLDATLAGLGLAYLPTWLIAEDLRQQRLLAVWPESCVENHPVHVLWPKTRSLAPKVRLVVDALVQRFSPPPWDPPSGTAHCAPAPRGSHARAEPLD